MSTSPEELDRKVAELEGRLSRLEGSAPEDRLSMVVMSGDLDHLLAAFIIATGASAMFEKVSMFFTFWATAALRDPKLAPPRKDVMGAAFGALLPKGPPKLGLSRMHFCGLGTSVLKRLMKSKGVRSLDELIALAAEGGVEIFVCEMSMNLMGMRREELIDYPGLKLAGVATFLQRAGASKASLFI